MRTSEIGLRGLAKLVAVLASVAVGGLAIGAALAKLSGDSGGATGGPPAGSASNPTTATSEKRASTRGQKPANAVRVRVVSAILHPASSSSGKRRQRARLSVHVRVTNRGSRRFVPSRPVLVSGDVRLKTDRNQDSADTNLEALAPGATGDVTLRFETAGTVTQRVRQQLRARLVIAGRQVTAPVKLGELVAPRAAAGDGTSSGTATQPPPPPVAAQPPAAPQAPSPPPPQPPAAPGFDSAR